MGGVVQLRDQLQIDLSKIPKQEQVRHQQSTRLDAPVQVRRQVQAGSGVGIKKNVTTGVGRGALKSSGAASASSSLSFPIKILDNLEDRNCTCSESFYMHDSLTTI